MPKSRTALLAGLKDQIHACLGDLVPAEAPLAILDFPDYRNVGDSAIWLGEMAYLRDRYGKLPAYVSRLDNFSVRDLDRAMPEGPIFLQGGGNFGDLWIAHQDFRERVLELCPSRQVIQFPQSIHYKSPARADVTARIIGRHKHFVLLVRDEESQHVAQQHFDCEVRLCPDMACYIGTLEPDPARFPVLAMLRNDQEKMAGRADQSSWPEVPIEDWITEPRMPVRVAKLRGAVSAMLDPGKRRLRMLDAAARQRVRRGVRQLSRGRAIVTDRLHVHIVSLLLGRPHAVLDNSYGKVRNSMSAFTGGTDLTYAATSLDDGIAWAREQANQREGA
ncbi:MAG TPA: polysaccharide pyruvyl transferase family protein [Gemmatimonadales bacterium]|jgi:pyruvyl transferase EpsO|nr:polysaccharide pyruvyl transferase family protein [Gemmatimonadales bacterium]